jgi:hypothetical protein
MAIDYSSILNDMKAKRSALDVSIAGLEAALASGALGQPSELPPEAAPGVSQSTIGGSIELPVGAFSNKSVPAAIKLYLAAVKRKQTNTEITHALRQGGLESTAESFSSIITTALNRLRVAGEVLRFKDGWGLAEHYNESLRARLAQNQKPVRKAKKKARAKAKRSSAEKIANAKPVLVVNESQGPQAVIAKYVSEKEGKRITTAEVASALNMRPQTVALILAKLSHLRGINKNADGSFDVGPVSENALVN